MSIKPASIQIMNVQTPLARALCHADYSGDHAESGPRDGRSNLPPPTSGSVAPTTASQFRSQFSPGSEQ
eukprot:5009763-Pleurochrysis_carterae.AAC.1